MTPSLAHASVAPTMANAPQPASTDIARPSRTSSAPPASVIASDAATRPPIRSLQSSRASSTVKSTSRLSSSEATTPLVR